MQNGGGVVVYLESHVPRHGESSTHVRIVGGEITVWLILVSTVDIFARISSLTRTTNL